VLGLRTHGYKLFAFVLGSSLAAAGGVVYLLDVGGADVSVTTPEFTLALLVMVVFGGSGTLWGPLLGGFLYTFLNQRLVAVGDSSFVQGLPDVLRTPLSQPLFLLGVLFILIVVFLPGGLVGIGARGRPSGLQRLESAVQVDRGLVEPQEEA
jgi:branched-chain amino acid transport system permease protein